MAEMDVNIPKEAPIVDPNVNYFGLVNYRNQNRKFGIKLDDRRRHMYIVGKTGMGKTTILENMVLNDIYGGHGVGLVDPHGDFAEKILDYIPPKRINDVVYFNPADIDYPIGFNILETIKPEHKHLVVSGLMGVFKKIWPDVWSARMEYILNNTILALMDFPGTTLLGINRMLADAEYRKRVVNNTKDPVVKAFWQNEFAGYNDKYRQEAVAPIQNKIGQFLSASVIRNIVAQVKSSIDIRTLMDERKIFIMNLSKGRIGEDNSRLLGGMLITKLQLAAMERVDIPEADRKDFFLYVDEFQNFATESFANILSEARKYRLDLIMAHQYMEQLDETVLAAVIGNVGTTVTFRVGSTDAEILAKEYAPTFTEEDLINLPKYNIYLKLMIDGVASRPFSALTLPPIAVRMDSMEKVVKVSRERYAVERSMIEDKIARWSGMVVMGDEQAEGLEMDPDEAMFADTKKSEAPKPVAKPGEAFVAKKTESFPARTYNTPPASTPPPSKTFNTPPRREPERKNDVRPPQNNKPVNMGRSTTIPKRVEEKKPVVTDTDEEPVLLVNPEEKGVSLSALMSREAVHKEERSYNKPETKNEPPTTAPETKIEPPRPPLPAPTIKITPPKDAGIAQPPKPAPPKSVWPNRVEKIGDEKP